VAVYCFTQPIQPGKREEAKAIFEEVGGPRRDEYEASRRRLGIRREKVWFQSAPNGEMAVVYWEGFRGGWSKGVATGGGLPAIFVPLGPAKIFRSVKGR
jgi:hypothetical protein